MEILNNIFLNKIRWINEGRERTGEEGNDAKDDEGNGHD